jgi:hypothetical protein
MIFHMSFHNFLQSMTSCKSKFLISKNLKGCRSLLVDQNIRPFFPEINTDQRASLSDTFLGTYLLHYTTFLYFQNYKSTTKVSTVNYKRSYLKYG